MGSLSDPITVNTTTAPIPFKVLVVGGSYGGLSAALNLQDLCRGKAPRCGPEPDKIQYDSEKLHIPIDITIVDERDGFCKISWSMDWLTSANSGKKTT